MRIFVRCITFIALIFAICFFHYSLPQRDIVRIVGTEVKRMDINDRNWFWASEDAGTNVEGTRDVRFINTERANDKVMVYRNEDTNWSWPPYLKFDSSNLTAEAQALAKSQQEKWVAVTHYGWRVQLFSMFPNAVKIKAVADQNVTLIPWFNIVFLIIVILLLLWIWRIMNRFSDRYIKPKLNKVSENVTSASEHLGHNLGALQDTAKSFSDEADTKISGFRAWRKRWFGK